ncbi:hypothetical protein BKK79_38550 (plasmid) [Cupriavidus sp. USMAA2-4]|nr:hypothetical protein BKK79_38550 [Cupriavidus sp. USMAA2-4]
MSQNDTLGKTGSDTSTDSNGLPATPAATPSRTAQNAPQGADQLNLVDMASAWPDEAQEPLEEAAIEPSPIVQIGSTTLARLDKSSRPIASTVCETCPAAVWYARGKKVQCYCRIMHLISWETGEANPITLCDGPAIASQ